MTILELREKRAKAWEAAKAFLDSHRNDKGILSAEDDAAYTRMEQEITDLGKEIARLEKQMKEAAKMMEYEYAAVLRDQIVELRGNGL